LQNGKYYRFVREKYKVLTATLIRRSAVPPFTDPFQGVPERLYAWTTSKYLDKETQARKHLVVLLRKIV